MSPKRDHTIADSSPSRNEKSLSASLIHTRSAFVAVMRCDGRVFRPSSPALSIHDARPATSHYARFYRRGARRQNRTASPLRATPLNGAEIVIREPRAEGGRS